MVLLTHSADALTFGAERIAAGDLEERVARLAHGLADGGVAPGDPVALVLPNGPAFVTAFLAVTRLGAVAVPLNPQFKQAELAFCIGDSGARTVVTDGDGAELCRTLAPRVVDDVDALAEAHAPLDLEPRAPGEDMVVCYSSGSTGRPKRVPRTHGELEAEVDAYVAATGITAADTIFCAIPLFHTYGMGCCLMAAVRSGATLAIMDAPHPFALRREHALRGLEQATVFPAVPFMLRVLAEAPEGADLASSLRLCFSAGNALPRSVFDAFARAFDVPVRQLYGLTETGCVTVNLDPDPWATAGTVGRALPGVDVAILDAAGGILETGRIGEVALRGPGLTRGYVGVTEQAFRDGWFLTGDRGRLDEEGRLTLTGRRKLLIDVKGEKVDPIEVEDVLAVHPRVRDVVVVGVPSEIEGESLIKAAVVPVNGSGSERELIRYCRERLANYKVPHAVEFLDEIPRSSLGKVLRKYLV
jgi:long-chain acyl-CoA synthetase